MKKLIYLVSMFLLVFAMKLAKAEEVVVSSAINQGQYMILFGHSLNESEISNFTVFINEKPYTGEIKINGFGRRYSEIPNEQPEGNNMTVYAVIKYKNGDVYQTEPRAYKALNIFGGGFFTFAKIS